MDGLISLITDTSKINPNPALQGMFANFHKDYLQNSPSTHPNLPRVATEEFLVPNQDTYATRYSSGLDSYYWYYDEALRNSMSNALAMRRSPFINEPYDHRKMAVVSQDWYIKTDDPKNPDQQRLRDKLESVFEQTSMLKQLMMNLLEDIYFGKSGIQFLFGNKMIGGKERIYIKDHNPVMGDKIQYKYDGTPGILVRGGSKILDKPEFAKNIDRTTLGYALFFKDSWIRDRFAISKFKTSDFDFIWEGDKALAVHGIGLRDSIYWTFNLLMEVFSWITDALQRVGANGMTIGFYDIDNPNAKEMMEQVISQLVKDNYAVIGVNGLAGGRDPSNMIHNIPISSVGFDVMLNIVKYLDDFIRRTFLGQELTSTARSSGMGAEVAKVQKSAFDHIVGYDSDRIAEVISREMIPVILRYNTWEYRKREFRGDDLPFSMRFMFEDRDDEDPKPAEVAETLHEIGVDIDTEDILDKTGFSAPKDVQSTLPGKDQAPAAGQDGTAQREGGGVAPNGRKQFAGFGNLPSNGKVAPSLNQLELLNGPPDEKRDDSGKWTAGGTSSAKESSSTKEKTQVSSKGNIHDINDQIKSVFGRHVDREAISSMAGTPSGSHSNISIGGNSVKISWKSDFGSAERSIRRNDNGKVVMDNISFNVDEKFRGQGLGAKVFDRQIEAAKAMGVSKIQTVAIRDDDSIGYKVWPLFGYDGDIPNSIHPPGGEQRVSELMKTPEGRDWWSKNGDTIELDFDLSSGSHSMKTWESYKRSKKVRK